MARYTGPVCRLCRREGKKLFLKGDRCYSDKCAVGRRQSVPGQHGKSRKKVSEYGTQLRAKQTARRYYGVMENQMLKYFDMAERMPGKTGENLLSILERRLDNVVYRLGFAASRSDKIKLVTEANASRPVPQWLDADKNQLTAKVVRLPAREDVDMDIEEQQIVEFYSK